MNYSPRSQVGLFFTDGGYTVAIDEHQKLRTNNENGGDTSGVSVYFSLKLQPATLPATTPSGPFFNKLNNKLPASILVTIVPT